MNKGCVFVLGFLAAIFLLFLAAYIFDDSDIQYIDIQGCHGEVTLHTNMSKDSVKILVGKPSRVDLRAYPDGTFEDWEYKIPKQGDFGTSRWFKISFVNGELKEIHEY